MSAAIEATARAYLAAPRAWAEVPTARIAYRRFGAGPPLLMVHGFPLSGFTWRKVLPSLAERHTCYAIDLPGLGETEWSTATDFSFPGQGRTLRAFADRVGLDRFAVLAQDTGGTFARYLALEDPARVTHLVLINTEMPHHRPPWIPLYQFLMALPGTLAAFRVLLRSRWYLRSPMGFGGCFRDLDLIDGDFSAQVVAPLLADPRRLDGLRAYLRGATWGPVDALAREHARLGMPVHLVWGADDPTFPIDLARRMAEQFPDARLTAVPNARLLVHEERPAEVARLTGEFLAA